MKVSQLLVFVRYSHTLKILVIPDGLKIPADEEEVHFVGVSNLKLLDVFVDRVQLPMAASFHGDLSGTSTRSGSSAYKIQLATYLHLFPMNWGLASVLDK